VQTLDLKLAACYVHGGVATDTRLLHEHHREPRGYGGADKSSNIVWLCGSCHDIIHRMDRWSRSGKQGLVSDLAVRYLPDVPAARKRLLELVAVASKTAHEFNPEEIPDVEHAHIVVQLHVPRDLHRKLKLLAYSHTNPNGRRVGLYHYIMNILQNHVALTQNRALKQIPPEKLFGVGEAAVEIAETPVPSGRRVKNL